MVRQLSYLFCFLMLFCPELIWAETPQTYVERVKKNHAPKRAVEIFSKRLTLELNNQKVNSNIALSCLRAIKDLDTVAYQKNLSKTGVVLKQSLQRPAISQEEKDVIFNFMYDVSIQLSVEDGFYLMDQLGVEYIAESSRFFADVLLQMKPGIYMAYFESKYDFIKSELKKYKNLLEFYCLTSVLSGRVDSCAEKIVSLNNSPKVEPWVSLLDLIVKMNKLDFEGATKSLNIIGANCGSNTNVPWINFHIARLYRMQKNIEKSLACLETFKSDTKDDPRSQMFYKLEYGKTIRFMDLKKSDAAFEEIEADKEVAKKSFGFFELIVEIEKAKNAILNNDLEISKNHLSRLKTNYRIDELKPYVELIRWLENYSKNREKPTDQGIRNLEIYDFSMFLDSNKEKLKTTN
jgi:hypothetical protein